MLCFFNDLFHYSCMKGLGKHTEVHSFSENFISSDKKHSWVAQHLAEPDIKRAKGSAAP